MGEYIDREAILEQIARRKSLMVGDKMISIDALRAFIMNRPIADVIPVIRCKDCKHWSDNDGIHTTADGVRFARCRIHNHETLNGLHEGWCPTENCYCSLGERKENINGN